MTPRRQPQNKSPLGQEKSLRTRDNAQLDETRIFGDLYVRKTGEQFRKRCGGIDELSMPPQSPGHPYHPEHASPVSRLLRPARGCSNPALGHLCNRSLALFRQTGHMVENGSATPSAGREDRPPFHHPEHSLDEDHRLLTQVGETAKATADSTLPMKMVRRVALASSY